MIAGKIALRLALSADLRQRWRQVSLVIVSCITVLLVLYTAALANVAWQVQEKLAARSFLPASEIIDRNIVIRRDEIFAQDRKVTVIWLDLANSRTESSQFIPPGLSRLPKPGFAVVSPGIKLQKVNLDELGLAVDPAGLGKSGEIGAGGLQSATELLIYARPPAGRSLRGKVFDSAGFSSAQQERARSTDWRLANSPWPLGSEFPSVIQHFLLMLVFLAVPLSYLVIGAARAMSPIRRARAETLWRFGTARRRIASIFAVESFVLAGLGALVATVLWESSLRHNRAVPWAQVVLFPEALHLPPLAVLAGATACTAIFVAAAGTSRVQPADHEIGSRRVRALQIIPLALALGVLLATLVVPRYAGDQRLCFLGLGLALFSLPLSLPAAVAMVGRAFSAGPTPMWLAGRRLALSSMHLSRPAALVGALTLISGACLADYEAVTTRARDSANSPYLAALITWPVEQTELDPQLEQKLPDFEIIPVDRRSGRPTFANCGQVGRVAQILQVPGCRRAQLPAEFTAVFRGLAGINPELTPGDPISAEGAVVLGTGRARPQLMTQIRAISAPVRIANLDTETEPNLAVGWVVLYWITASGITLLAMLREVGDRGMLALSGANLLRRLTFTQTEVHQVDRWLWYFPIGLAGVIGYGTAVLFAAAEYESRLTGNQLLRISISSGIALAGSTLLLALVYALSCYVEVRAARRGLLGGFQQASVPQ